MTKRWKKPTAAQLKRQVAEKRLSTEAQLGMTIEEWRLKKRQEWRAVVTAIEKFTYGCAYTPTGNDFYELTRTSERITETLKDDWVCW